MKKSKLILVILLLLICSTGCTNSQQLSASTTSANQDEFLQAMATGISARLADSKDDSDMTDEQKAEYFSKLVDYELSKISKYENATFTDETLNDLAHEYINACNSQKIATKYYKNTQLYNALWSDAWNIRAAIISYLYQNYELPITSEQAAEYNTTGSVSYTVDSDTANSFNAFNDDGEVQLSQGDLSIIGADKERKTVLDDVFFNYSYIVRNNSTATLNLITVHCSILDKNENVIGTTSANIDATILPNKDVSCDGSITLGDYPTAAYIRIDNLTYDGNNNNIVHELAVDSTEITEHIIAIN